MKKKHTRLKMLLWYFPEREQTEHWQLIIFAFLDAALHSLTIVYGTKGKAIIVKIKIGKRVLFSSEAAILSAEGKAYRLDCLHTWNCRYRIDQKRDEKHIKHRMTTKNYSESPPIYIYL